MQTIALFGGSFDPPHIAHETIVKEALKIKDIEKVVVMPTFLNPFKSVSHAPSSLRIKWLRAIFKEFENVEVNSFEVDSKRKISTIVSVKHLLKRYKKIYLIVGADNLESLPLWDRYDELKTLVTFVVATRNNIKVPEDFLTLRVEEDISSTLLRDDIDSSMLPKVCSKEIIQFYKEKNDK